MAPRERNIKRVREGLEQLQQFRSKGVNAYAAEFGHWRERVQQALQELFPNGPYGTRFSDLHFCLPRVQVLTSRSRSATGSWTRYDQEAYEKDAVIAEQLLSDALEEVGMVEETTRAPDTNAGFIDPARIADLRAKKTPSYDLKRLIQLCEELNICYANKCYLAVAALSRALLDHVPPLLGANSFAEEANNYAGSKSFKESMAHLEKSARKISDSHLHQRIRTREDVPTRTQVDISRDLDVLLGEIIRTI